MPAVNTTEKVKTALDPGLFDARTPLDAPPVILDTIAHHLESDAKTNIIEKKRRAPVDLDQAIEKCGSTYLRFLCLKDREYFYKKIYCGSPACPTCRRSDWKNDEVSAVVRRRVSLSWPKIMWARSLVKIVLTFPRELQNQFFDREEMNLFYHLAGEFARKITGVDAVLVNLHPVGNKGNRFHPHLECLIPFDQSEWADPFDPEIEPVIKSWIARLGKSWGAFLFDNIPESFDNKAPGAIQARMSFADKAGKMVHRIRYALDYHWAKDYESWSTTAKDFLKYLRGARLARGYGLLSDKKWKTWVKDKPYYWETLKDKDADPDDSAKCPICDSYIFPTYRVKEYNGRQYKTAVYDCLPDGYEAIPGSELIASESARRRIEKGG